MVATADSHSSVRAAAKVMDCGILDVPGDAQGRIHAHIGRDQQLFELFEHLVIQHTPHNRGRGAASHQAAHQTGLGRCWLGGCGHQIGGHGGHRLAQRHGRGRMLFIRGHRCGFIIHRFGQCLGRGLRRIHHLIDRNFIHRFRGIRRPAIFDNRLKPLVDLGRGFEHFGFQLLKKGQARSPNCQAFSMIYRLDPRDGRATRAIDSKGPVAHQVCMRFLWVLWVILMAGPAQAEPDQRYCSSTKWGHAHCIRPAHFVYDTCNAIKVFSERHGLDSGFFARLIWQESRFDQNALSHANARGIAQFIPSTAALRGLKDPYNPADALEHSAQYLAEMTQKYGNEGLAAIGYNGGERRAEGFLDGKGLAPETVAYVPIITGLDAEQWRDAPPKTPDFRLSKTQPFLPACYEMARNRRVTALKVTPPAPVIKPWGVQVSFGTSKDRARDKANAQTASCRSAVKGRRLDFLFKKNRVSRRKGFYFGQYGSNTRTDAQRLCDSMRATGCTCLVVQN